MKSPPTRARSRYHHGDLRNALLETALALVAQRGPEGFSLREAAREIGVSPAAAYRHFSDKTSLLAALAEDGHGRLAASMERSLSRIAVAPGTKAHAAQALLAIAEGYLDFAVRHPAHFRVMFGPSTRVKGFSPCCAPSGRGSFQILVDALDGLVTAGVISPEQRVGAEVAAWAGVHGLATAVVEGSLPLDSQQRADAVRGVTRTFLLGVGCDPALMPSSPRRLDVDLLNAMKRVDARRRAP